ncbi:hypothetical protein PIB30_041038, partial [Stylosanthes scabra]|nr:hypothetical protein [Stylosanthes scabra]
MGRKSSAAGYGTGRLEILEAGRHPRLAPLTPLIRIFNVFRAESIFHATYYLQGYLNWCVHLQVMKPQSDNHSTEPRNLGHSSSAKFSGINFGEVEAKHRMLLIQWLNSLLPTLNLPMNITDDELRVCLSNGTILCQVMNKLRPGSVSEVSEFDDSPSAKSENVKRFLKAIDALGMPKFELSDLEKGPMKNVVDCLLTLRAKSLQNAWGDNISMTSSKVRSITSSPSSHSKFQSVLRSPVMAEPSAALLHHVGHKFHEVFQMKQGSYAELPAAKISELMKSTSLNNAPTQSLLSVVNAILEESVERRNSEIPHRVAVLLRKVVQEIERRISTQADHLRTQNNLFKAREEKYQSRIRVLEVLASGAKDESEGAVRSPMRKQQQTTVANAIIQPKELTEVTKMEEKKAFESIQGEKAKEETEKEDNQELEAEIKGAKEELKEKSQEYEHQLETLNNKVRENEASYESKYQKWNMKVIQLQKATTFQLSSIKVLKLSSETVKQHVLNEQTFYAEEFKRLGVNLKPLVDAAENYQVVLAENRKLFNDIQELKGNIRVYCRVRPFLPGQKEKQSIVENYAETEMVVANPAKPGKDGLRSFKFNRVFGPTATQ